MRLFSFLLSLRLLLNIFENSASNCLNRSTIRTCNFFYQQKESGVAIYSIEYNGHEVFSVENNSPIEKTGMELTLGDNYYMDANSKARNIILEEVSDAQTTKSATTQTTTSTSTPVPTTTTPSTPALMTTTLPLTTQEQTLDIKIWAGMVIYGIMVNGIRTGNNHGGGILDVPMQQGETVLALEYGIKRDQEGEPWANGICGLSIITDVKMHGPYGDIGPNYPCPTEYFLEIPFGMGLSDFLENEKIMDVTGDWILGFNSQVPIVSTTIPPSTEPTYETIIGMTDDPNFQPTFEPTGEPTSEPTGEPTLEPTSPPGKILNILFFYFYRKSNKK